MNRCSFLSIYPNDSKDIGSSMSSDSHTAKKESFSNSLKIVTNKKKQSKETDYMKFTIKIICSE